MSEEQAKYGSLEEKAIEFADNIKQISEYDKGRWDGRIEGFKACAGIAEKEKREAKRELLERLKANFSEIVGYCSENISEELKADNLQKANHLDSRRSMAKTAMLFIQQELEKLESK